MEITTDRTEQRAHDERICQLAAEALWQAATSNNVAVARYDSATYRALERAFTASVREVYGLSALKARRVLNLLEELGPNDGANGTSGWGVQSYVQYARDNRTSSAYDR